MVRFILTTMALISVFLTGCQSTPEQYFGNEHSNALRTDAETQSLLIGAWYGKYDDGFGTIVEFINSRSSDGKYAIKFRMTDSDGFSDLHEEQGRWRVQGNVYSTTTTEVSGAEVDQDNPYYNDDYRIVAISQNTFQYTHTIYDTTVIARRVAADFDFPPIPENAKENRPAVQAQTKPAQFTDDARAYVLLMGRKLVDQFNQVCASTRLDLDLITLEAERLEWTVGQTRPTEENIRRWTSFEKAFKNQSPEPEPIFILDVAVLPTSSEVFSCTLTTWGTSALPEIGKQEFDLIAKTVLSDGYEVGDVQEQSKTEEIPMFDTSVTYVQLTSELSNSDESEIRFFYNWVGGTHNLSAASAN